MRKLIFGILYLLLWGATALAWALLAFAALAGMGANPSAATSGGFGTVILIFLTLNVLTLLSIPAIPVVFGMGSGKSQTAISLLIALGLFIGIPVFHGQYKAGFYRKATKYDQVNRDFTWPDSVAYYKGRTGCDDLCSELLYSGHAKSLTVYPTHYGYEQDKDKRIKIKTATTFTIEARETCPRIEGSEFQDKSRVILKNNMIGRCLIAKNEGRQMEPLQILWDESGRTSKNRDKFKSFSRLRITEGQDGHNFKSNSSSILAQQTDVSYFVLQTPLIWPFPKTVNSGGSFGDKSYNPLRDPLSIARLISPLGEKGDEYLSGYELKRKYKNTSGGKPEPNEVLKHTIATLSELRSADMPADRSIYELAWESMDLLTELPQRVDRDYRNPLGLALLNASEVELTYRSKHPNFKASSHNGITGPREDAILNAYQAVVYQRKRKYLSYNQAFSNRMESIHFFEDNLLDYVAKYGAKYEDGAKLSDYDREALEFAIEMLVAKDRVDEKRFQEIWNLVSAYSSNQNFGFDKLLRRYNAPISDLITEDVITKIGTLSDNDGPNRWIYLLEKISDHQFEKNYDKIVEAIEKNSHRISSLYPYRILNRLGKGGERSWSVLNKFLTHEDVKVRRGAARGLCLAGGPLNDENYAKLRDALFFELSDSHAARDFLRYFYVSGYIERFKNDLASTLVQPDQKHKRKYLEEYIQRYANTSAKDCKVGGS